MVVLYNPDPGLIVHNIQSYVDEIDRLFVVDNSENPKQDTVERLKLIDRLTYIRNNQNVGIAKALNIAAQHACANGYGFLLTMDQDSKAEPGMIASMLACLNGTNSDSIGIITPVHVYAHSQTGNPDTPCEEVLTAMTSGNLLNLKAYQAVGPFLENIFIDHVDDEYCMRLRLHGFGIIRANNARLVHSVGDITEHKLLFKKFAISNHSPIRKYYGTRNNFFLKKNYKRHFPLYFHFFYWKLLREIATIILYERHKLRKLAMMARGYLDYRKGIYGKYAERRSS